MFVKVHISVSDEGKLMIMLPKDEELTNPQDLQEILGEVESRETPNYRVFTHVDVFRRK